MALDYKDVLDQYDLQQQSGVTTESLPEWSARMNQLTGSNLYSAGFHDNWIKRASVGIDRLLEKTGAPEASAQFGRVVGGLVGQPEVGEETGRGLPRMAVNLAPLLIPGAGVPGAIARFGLTGALAGAETYTATDSPLAGVISGAAFAGMSPASHIAEQFALKKAGAKFLEGPLSSRAGEEVGKFAGYVADKGSLTQKIAGLVGGQVGALGTMAAGQVGTQLASGQPVTNPLSIEGATGLGISMLPFTALHLGARALGLGRPTPRASDVQTMLDQSQARIELKAASERLEKATPIADIKTVQQPLDIDPEMAKETARILSEVRGETLRIKNDPTLTPEQKVDQTNIKMDEEARLRRVHTSAPDAILGNTILPDAPRQEVLGHEMKVNRDGTWRAILVSDDPMNPEELRGRVVGYSTKGEPPPAFGAQSQQFGGGRRTLARYSLPETQWWSFAKPKEEWSKKWKFPLQEPGFGKTTEPFQVPTEQLLGEFPQQPEMTRERLSEHLNELRTIEESVRQVQTPAELQQAVVQLHGVQGENDIPLTNDGTLQTTTERLLNAGVKPGEATKQAIIAESKKVASKLQEESRLPTPEERVELGERMGEGGFTIIDSSHLSHGESEDIAEAPATDMVNEAAHNAVRNPAVQTAFAGWPESGDASFPKDVADFVDLVGKFGGRKNVLDNLDAAAKYLGEGRGFGPRDPEDVAEYMNRPHVVEMFNGLDQNLAAQQGLNRALAPTLAPIPSPIISVAGRKGVLLKNEHVNQIVKSFVEGQDVTDAFGGSGQLSHFAKGAGATTVNLNIREPQMRAVFDEVKTDPEGFAARVEQAVAPIKSTREISTPTLEDGSPIGPYLDELTRTDPNVALFIKQNLNAAGREVVGGAFTPTKVISSVGLKDLPNRIREFSKSIDSLSSEDGWQIVANANAGDRVLVDPPYVGAGGLYVETGRVSTEQRLADYENHLYPAAERGANFTVFDVADPQLIKSLQDHGFTVEQVQRTSRGRAEVQPELVAYNHPEAQPDRIRAAKEARQERYVPTEEERGLMSKYGIDRGGQGILDYLQSHSNPFFKALGDDLAKFGDSIQRVTSSIQNIDSGRALRRQGDRFDLQFNPGILHADDFTRGYWFSHELIHGLSQAELENPTKVGIVNSLDQLRQDLIGKLPSNMRKAYDAAVQGDWIGKYSRGEVDADSLMPKGTTEQMDVLYGLLNNHEFLSQGLSNVSMRNFMGEFSTGGQRWYSRFANVIRSLLGIGQRVDATAFEEFLSHTDQLLERGDYVANFRNFGDRYFQNMGMRDDIARQNTSRALGLLMGVDKGTTPESLLDNLRLGAGAFRSPEWAEANRSVIRMFQQKEEEHGQTISTIGEQGYEATPTGLTNFAHDLLTGDANKGAVDLLPSAATSYVFETARDAKNILSVLDAAARDRNKGAVNLRDPSLVRGPVKEALQRVNDILASEDSHDRAVRDIQGLYSTTPDGFFDKMMGDPLRGPSWALDKKPEELGRIWRALAPIAQIARRIPSLSEVLSKGYQLTTNARKMESEALKPMGTDLETLTLSEKTVKDTVKTVESRKLEGIVSRWMELTQVEGGKKGKTEPILDDDPRVQKLLGGLSTKERDQVSTLMQQRRMSNEHMQNQILEKGMQIAAVRGGSLVQRVAGGKLDDAIGLADQLLKAFTADRSDPVASRAADASMTQVQNRLTPDAFLDLARFTQNAAEEWKEYQKWFQENPDWASAQRYGKFIAEFKRGGKAVVVGVNSRKEAESLAKGAPLEIKPNRQDEADKPPYLGPDAPGIINRLRELQQNQIDILRSKGVITDDEGAEMLKRYSPTEQLATEETYRRGVPQLTPQPRRLTKLAEEHPWLQNHFSWVRKTSTYWSRQLLREQVRAHLLDPELAQNKELSSLVKDHYDNMLKPDTEIGRFMQKAASTWFMGFNVATAMMNATQPFLTHVAELTSMTGKPLDSYRRVLKALAEAGKGGLKHTWKTADHEWLMERAAQDGIRDLSMYDDQAAAQDAIATNYKRAMSRNTVQSLGQKFGTMAGNFSNVGLWLFRQVERLNADTALLAGFDHYRESEPNLSRDEAYAKARDFNASVNYGGGAAQRSVGLYKHVPRTPAMLATAMQSYTLGTTFQLARYIRSGLFRPAGLTPHEVYSARKAAVQMLGTQFALAGVLGLPFVSAAIAALDKAFPDLETNKHLREWMNQIAGEDENNGNVLTDIGMTGIPSMFGWDAQSRLSMGNTLPGVSEINGFQPEALLGAPANMVSTFVAGTQKVVTGQPHAVDAFVPPALKKIFQLFRNDFQALDYKNRPIFKPTSGEVAGMFLGFQPKRLSDFNAAARITALSQDNINRREGQFHQQQAEEVLKGNFGSVHSNLRQRTAEDKAYDPVAAVRSIARAAEELTFPRDLRREGTARSSDMRTKLLQAFNLPPTQASETNRLQFRNQVEQRLGLYARSSTGLRQAQLMDELRKQAPEATRSELRQQASHLLRGPSLQTTALLQE